MIVSPAVQKWAAVFICDSSHSKHRLRSPSKTINCVRPGEDKLGWPVCGERLLSSCMMAQFISFPKGISCRKADFHSSLMNFILEDYTLTNNVPGTLRAIAEAVGFPGERCLLRNCTESTIYRQFLKKKPQNLKKFRR